MDTKLRLPNIGQTSFEAIEDKNENSNPLKDVGKNSLYEESANSSNGSLNSEISESSILKAYGEDVTEPPMEDYLRNHLDVNLQVGSVPYDETMFEHVKNSRMRQLLVDNYRLLRIKERKQAENKELWGIFKTYEQLLTEVVIPKLSLDINGGNILRIEAARAACIDQKFPLEDEVWQTYCKYIEHLEKVRVVSVKLAGLLEGHLQSEKMQRLATQVNIVEDLIKHLSLGGLQRNRSAAVDIN